jgi:putative peptidoglycan lipid II flippase
LWETCGLFSEIVKNVAQALSLPGRDSSRPLWTKLFSMTDPASQDHSPDHHARIMRSAGVVAGAVLLSRMSGLVREVAMARLFGASEANDAFLLGFRIPNLTRDLFAEGALSAAFVPTFTHYLTTKGKKEAAVLSDLVGTAVILLVGALCVLGVVFSPALVWLLASNWFTEAPSKAALAVHLTRIMFPFLLLVALAAQGMGILNACGQFGVPALASFLFNIGSVAFGLTLGFVIGPHLGITPIEGMAYGVVLGGALQMFWQFPSLRRAGFSFRPRWMLSHPGLRQILLLMGPAIVGNAAVQINVMVNTNFAAGIVDPLRGVNGPVSWLAYAFRFMQLPLGVFGVAIGAATLPSISRSASLGDIAEFRQTLSKSLGMVFLLTFPSSVGLVVLGKAMIAAVYQGGKFQAYDTHQTALALSCYAIGLVGYAATKILAPAFYALRDARTPMIVSVCSIAINFVVAWCLVKRAGLGPPALALSTSAVALFGFLSLFWILRNRIGGIEGRALLASTIKICAASLAMGAVVLASDHAIIAWLGSSKPACLADVLLSALAGLLVFYALCRAMKVPELEAAGRALNLKRWPTPPPAEAG